MLVTLIPNRVRSASAIAFLCVVLAGGCGHPGDGATADAGADAGSSDSASGCTLGFLGTMGMPVDMKLLIHGAGSTATEIADGARVPLILPPQGGRVVFLGVKATNIAACEIKLTGSVRDTTNRQVRVDARTINLRPSSDGWGASDDTDLSTFSNVPLCPNQWASTDIFENAFELSVTVTDKTGLTATKTIQATPFCGEPSYVTECMCECQKGYVLGQMCADAGK